MTAGTIRTVSDGTFVSAHLRMAAIPGFPAYAFRETQHFFLQLKAFTWAYNPKHVWTTTSSVESPTQVSVILQRPTVRCGDYAGLAADARGTFHAFWIDDRTGLAQVWWRRSWWTEGVMRNGDATLSELADVSSDVDLKIVSSNYDRASNTVTLVVRCGIRPKSPFKDL